MRYYGPISISHVTAAIGVAIAISASLHINQLAHFLVREGTVLSDLHREQAVAQMAAIRQLISGTAGE